MSSDSCTFRIVDTGTWGDEKVRDLSEAGKLLWLYFLTGPEVTTLPGLRVGGRAHFAEAMDWDLEKFDATFKELTSRGMILADWRARLVWLPNAYRRLPKPRNTQVIRGWKFHWNCIPECPLKAEAYLALDSYARSLGEVQHLAFIANVQKPKCLNPNIASSPSKSPSKSSSGSSDPSADLETEEDSLTRERVDLSGEQIPLPVALPPEPPPSLPAPVESGVMLAARPIVQARAATPWAPTLHAIPAPGSAARLDGDPPPRVDGVPLRPDSVATDPPDDIPITDEIRSTCRKSGWREPTQSDVRGLLVDAELKKKRSYDWGKSLLLWMHRQKQFDDQRRGNGGGKPHLVQEAAGEGEWKWSEEPPPFTQNASETPEPTSVRPNPLGASARPPGGGMGPIRMAAG